MRVRWVIRFAQENKDVVVIDNDPEAIRRVSDGIDVQSIHGSGASPLLLEEAGIKEAEILCMLLGRLEIFTVIIFLVPEFYRK